MDITSILLIFCCLAIIIGAVMTLRHSAKKFKLTDEQLKKVKERADEQQLKDQQEK